MTTNITEIDQRLKALVGLKAWGIKAGKHKPLLLRFGEPVLDPSDGNKDGEYELHIHHSMWRLETDEEMLVAFGDGAEKIQTVPALLENLTIIDAQATLPAFDLRITFEKRISLLVFPVRTHHHDYWLLFSPDKKYIAARQGNEWTLEDEDTD